MRLFIEEYGRIIFTVLLSAALLGSVFTGFMRKWQEMGGVNDSIKTDFETDEGKRTPPILIARDVKIHSGDPIDVTDYVSASDFDGRELSSLIQVNGVGQDAGVVRYELKVTSPVTGKSAGGKLVVLLDCYGDGGDGLICG